MILFLTYHKVVRGPEKEPEFYTVRAEQLERQLEMIAEKGVRPMAMEELVAGGVRPKDSLCPNSPLDAARSGSEIPPHPGPLPQGEGESSPVGGANRASSEGSLDERCSSLSPGERAGVRGNGSSDELCSPLGGFILSFDDGTVDHYDVVCPLLEKAGRTGIFFVPTAKLNRPGYLTNKMVARMAKVGHTIGLHGHEHRRLDEFGEEDIRVQMEVSRSKLEELTGSSPTIFAPPGGYLNRQVQAVALETGVRTIRTMRWGYNRQVDLAALECIPINRHSTETEFKRVLEFRSQAVAYAAKQIARKVVPKSIYEPLREIVARGRKGGA